PPKWGGGLPTTKVLTSAMCMSGTSGERHDRGGEAVDVGIAHLACRRQAHVSSFGGAHLGREIGRPQLPECGRQPTLDAAAGEEVAVPLRESVRVAAQPTRRGRRGEGPF